jgi:hypothetical protein
MGCPRRKTVSQQFNEIPQPSGNLKSFAKIKMGCIDEHNYVWRGKIIKRKKIKNYGYYDDENDHAIIED